MKKHSRFIISLALSGCIAANHVVFAENAEEATPSPTPSNVLPVQKDNSEKMTDNPIEIIDSMDKSPSITPEIQQILKQNFAPPLSLAEAIRLTEKARILLLPDTEQLEGPRSTKAQKLISLVKNFVKLADERSSNLLYYKWYYIGRNRVEREEIEEDIYDAKPPIPKSSAISFEATGEDVLIHHMKVIDIQNNEIEFSLNKWILEGLPRKEVCYMYFPVTVKQVVIDYSTRKDSVARLKVYVGVTDNPEYGKASLYYLTRTVELIQKKNLKEAAKDLEKARNQMILFNKRRF